MIENIKQKILQLDAGTFQNLCNSYLYKKGYRNLMSLGSQAGTKKTTRGTPDAYFITHDDNYIFTEYTTQANQVYQKIKGDLEKCLDVSKTKIPHDKIAEIIYCHTSSNISPAQDDELRSLCKNVGIHLILIGIDTLAEELHLYHHDLAKKVLGITLSTGQILSYEDFIKSYNANKTAAPIDTEFSLREKELDEIEEAFAKYDVVIISGAAGTGKTRLALHYAVTRQASYNEKLFCIHNKAQPLYEDLALFIDVPGNYFLVIDDANQLSELEHIFRYTIMQPDGINVKILITVRDYAIPKIQNQIRGITSYNTIKIDRFKDDEIKTLVKSTLGILNLDYLERIVNISEGNARLAIIAGKIAIDTERLSSIYDASELYEDYYGKYLQDNNLLTNKKLLITATIVAFLDVLHLDHFDHLLPVLESCDLSRNDFVENIRILHENEIVDICNDKAVKFAEQCLSNYLLKYSFYDKKYISLSLMARVCFGSRKERTIHSIITLLSVFRNKELYQFVEQEVKNLWNVLLQENSPHFFDFVKAFFRVNPTATLLILKKKIDTEEAVIIASKDIDFQTGKNNQSVDNDIIEILSGFADMNDLPYALDLFFQYYLKRPDLGIKFFHAINRHLGIRKESYYNEFCTQITLFEKIAEYSDDWKQESINLLFLEIAEEFLKLMFSPIEGGRNHSITMYYIPLVLSAGVESYRKLIWKALSNLCEINRYKDRVWRILDSYSGPIKDTSVPVLEYDINYIRDLIETHFPASELRNALLVDHILELLNRMNVTCDTFFTEYFKSEDYQIYCLLKGPDYSDEVDWEERQGLKRQTIENYVINLDIRMIHRIIDVNLYVGLTDHYKKWEVGEGMVIAFDILSNRENTFIPAIKYLLAKDTPNNLHPEHLVSKLFSLLPDADVFEIINSCGCQLKNMWLYAYYHELPQELITTSYLQGLYEFLADSSDSGINSSGLRDVDFLEKYTIIDNEAFAKGCKIILSKAEYSPFIAQIYFGLLFNSHHNKPREVIRKFQNGNLELLVEIYFFMIGSQGHHSDYNGEFLREFYLAYPPTLDKYIDSLLKKEHVSYREYREKHRCFFETDGYIEIYDQIFERLLQKFQFPSIFVPSYLKAILSQRKDAPELLHERQGEWIKHCIQTFFSNKQKMDCIFSVISELSDDRKHEYVGEFLKHNKSVEDFMRIPLTPTSYTFSESAIPLYHRWIDYLTSLLPLFTGVAWLEHRSYIENKIENLRKQIESEEIEEVLRG